MSIRQFAFYLIIFAVIFYSKPLNGQSIFQSKISGIVADENGPLEFVTVFVYEQPDTITLVQIATTDSTGNFSINVLSTGNYLFRFKMPGYKTTNTPVIVSHENAEINLPTIHMVSTGKILDGVELVYQRDLIKRTPQGFIINAADNLTQASGTATDLLKNTPTVVVDADGNITIRGKSPLILINGRNSTLSSTDRIPASNVESIEIINNPPARYDADSDGGIINIKLKKGTGMGTNGSIAGGFGHGAKFRGNSAFILNHQTQKWNLGISYGNRFAQRTRKANANRTNFGIPQEYYQLQNRHDNRDEQTHNLKLNIDRVMGKKSVLAFEAIGNLEVEDNYETLITEVQDQSQAFQTKNSRYSSEHTRYKTVEGALNYSKKFDDERKSLDANLSSSYNFLIENTNITTQALNSNNTNAGNPFLQLTYNNEVADVSNARIDFSAPVGKKAALGMGYKGIYRYANTDFQSKYNLNDVYIANPAASNIFHFREQVHAAYLEYKSSAIDTDSSRLKYGAGMRVEQVYNHGYGETGNVSFNRAYFNVYPSASVMYNLKQGDYVKLNYSRRINRPQLGQLNPFTDITDSLNPHSGNPYLRPEYIHSVEAGYAGEWRKTNISINGFYRYAKNIIQQYMQLYPNGVALRLPVNVGNSVTYGIEGTASIFPVKWWSSNVSVSLYRQIIDGSNVAGDVANDLVSWYGKLINNFTLWKGGKLQVTGNYTSPVATPQGSRIAVYFVDAGFQQKLFGSNGALGIVATDVFNTQKNGMTAASPDFSYQRIFKVDTRAVLVTFTYSFKAKLKEELLENKFSND
jgi:outer membrane receptor protein involved in Fe transport